jgi:exopolysaccharide biosynthesis WecB/TagA/CpsF family protein
MLGVGAVFLYHSGALNKGPEILKKLSLRWLYRLFQQPVTVIKRKKMLPGIAGFLKLVIKYNILRK